MTEVLVVVAILAIVAAVAAPRLGSTAGTRLASAASMLAADLDYARLATLTRSDRPTVVVFDVDGAGYHLAHADTPDEPVTRSADHAPYVVRFGRGRANTLAGVTIDTTIGGGVLSFGAFGQLDAIDPAVVTLTAEGRTVRVTVDPVTGEPEIGAVQ